jgi:hypothetical protein
MWNEQHGDEWRMFKRLDRIRRQPVRLGDLKGGEMAEISAME